ncbi:hypothetical protein KAI87_17740, partial [Myxococcota bacterium]|nr:hypothetical protein [Myxococcota bacterium]
MKTPLPDGSVDTAAGSFFSCRILIWQIPFELITDHPLVAGIARDFFAGFQRTSLSPKLVYRIEGRDLSLWRNGRRLRAWGDVLAVFPAFEGVLYSDLIYESDGLILHSAALLYGERAWLVSGESGAGKSTLAAQMTQAGFIYLGDEYSRVDINFGAEAMPRPLKLDEAPTTFKLSQAREVGYEFEHKDGSLQKSSMWLWDASLRATGRWPLGGIIMISHGKEKL